MGAQGTIAAQMVRKRLLAHGHLVVCTLFELRRDISRMTRDAGSDEPADIPVREAVLPTGLGQLGTMGGGAPACCSVPPAAPQCGVSKGAKPDACACLVYYQTAPSQNRSS